MKEQTSAVQAVAVIDIGSSAVRMVIAEFGDKAEIKYLETLQKPVHLGKDVFTTGRISNKAMRESIAILKNYKTVMNTYSVSKVQAIATSAIRDAENRDNFIDQVFVRTGFDIEIIEGPEENRLELIAVENALKDKIDLENRNCLIVEVGSGSTEMIILNKGQVEVTRTLSMGSVRLPEKAIAGQTDSAVMQRVLKRSIQEVVKYAGQEYSLDQIDTFIGLGADMRFASRQIVENIPERFAVLDKKAFLTIVTKIQKMAPEEIVEKYGVSYTEAETLYPALLFYSYFLSETKAESLIVPTTTIRDALLLEMAQFLSGYKRTDVSKQVINSARHLAEKYKYDKTHAQNVASLSLKLFDALQQDHGLGVRERLLLEISAVLHEIGVYVSPTDYHKHSKYLIDAVDLFGLRKADKDIVSNVVRYHRGRAPQADHVWYMSLPKADRAIVLKLAAILRVSYALDRSRQQKIRTFNLEREEDLYTIWIEPEVIDISMERDALVRYGILFSEVFGASIVLKQGVPVPKA